MPSMIGAKPPVVKSGIYRARLNWKWRAKVCARPLGRTRKRTLPTVASLKLPQGDQHKQCPIVHPWTYETAIPPWSVAHNRIALPRNQACRQTEDHLAGNRFALRTFPGRPPRRRHTFSILLHRHYRRLSRSGRGDGVLHRGRMLELHTQIRDNVPACLWDLVDWNHTHLVVRQDRQVGRTLP